ncbi:hypothetical protein EPD60_08085 [Flaviaesturariibacter flavus]|uniref:Histidine kinase domain-containing protein n=1 Tax=Flaviaesturariibacter flavus TaxID=2502780 RepID=A0A4R1BAJ9_9BACT|nr:ATP-binding protein [Flaviaesturariibacter flavus]TCJ13964.1 hypothetical protein EPD60_08085 [Flaviaesturariibacter flavus]
MLDYRKLFDSFPGACLLLAPKPPDFTILDVNAAYLGITQTTRAIIGRPLFEVFPDNPGQPDASGVKNLTASLHQVLNGRAPHQMAIQRYDTLQPGTDRFRIRFWKPTNIPVFSDDGSIACILHTVEEVTDMVLLRRGLKDQSQRQIRDAVLTTQEMERMEISQELHDNINQILFTARLFLEKAKSAERVDDAFLVRGHELVLKAIDEVKKLSNALLDYSPEEKQLTESLEDVLGYVVDLKLFNLTRNFELPDEPLIESKIKTTVIRILQEQLANVIKHADAHNVIVTIHFSNNELELSIRDDGKGFDMTRVNAGMGFQSMKTRAAVMDGRVDITSYPGDGCQVRLALPIRPR